MPDWTIPLAERVRPSTVEEVVGQRHLLQPGQALYRALSGGALHSMILWGPPGTGKTTIARLVANSSDADLFALSAVGSGVKDIRAVVEAAKLNRTVGKQSVLFIDEVHRFNKAQQDGFLPHVEDGTLILVGATTENPAFELNNALLSRARVYVLKSLSEADIAALIERTLGADNGLGELQLDIDTKALSYLASAADGDARRALSFLETAADLSKSDQVTSISVDLLKQVITRRMAQYDKGGDHFYDQISALHKAIRGANPDAALFWGLRMLEGGCDPHYLLRRLMRIASEDIGNADPRGLEIVNNAWSSFDRLGHPEGDLAIMQAVIYLAVAPKSNASYVAYKAALKEVRNAPAAEVPAHLRNAPTRLAKSMGHGAAYRYAPNEPGRYAAGQTYFPDAMGEREYYHPVAEGLEIKIAERLAHWRALDQQARQQKP